MPRDLRALLSPRAVAVVGASPRAGSVAGEILRNLQSCKFRGELLPVNPKHEEVGGLPCHRSIGALRCGVDLAVLAINRSLVLDAVAECGERGIRNLIIITAGFKEAGNGGVRREERLRELIDEFDLNVVGPNCMGIIVSFPDVRLNASFSRWFPPGGEIAFISQSGSLGETLLECFGEAGLGVSLFVNLGNRAGLSENDFLENLEHDDRCGAIFLYLESFAEPTTFRGLVERISRTKPVVVLKAGRTDAGAAAVASHTGSLASSDAIVDAFLHQCGAIRVTTIEETLTALRVLERGILPRGRRTAILTNAGGAGIIAADACERVGIEVARLDDATRDRLAAFLPAEAGLGNPIDMIATAGALDYERSLEVVLEAVDSAIVIFRPPLVLRDAPDAVADGIIRVVERLADKPVLICALSREVSPLVERFRIEKIPVFAMPETAVDALAVLHRARELRDQQMGGTTPGGYDTARAKRVIHRALSEDRMALYFDEGADVLAAYGIPVCPYVYLDPGAPPSAASELGFPVVAKVDSPTLFHRFEKGAVITGIETKEDLADAVRDLRGVIDSLGLADARILAQRTLTGRELIFGLERDPAFGPVVMFGLGGTFVEALKDVAFSVAPVSEPHAQRTIRSIRAFPILEAFRGQSAVDLVPLGKTLAALAQLGLDCPEIVEIDLNPIVADASGAAAVDLLFRLDARPTAREGSVDAGKASRSMG